MKDLDNENIMNVEHEQTGVRKALTFYRFVQIDEPALLRDEILDFGLNSSLKGTVLIAREGVNGTVVGTFEELDAMRLYLISLFGEMPFNWSEVDQGNEGFFRFKVKLKEEIVTFGVDGLDIVNNGRHVDVQEWNDLISDPQVLVIDTRNDYEIDIGTFPEAVSPKTTNFRDFPDWVDSNIDPQTHPKVAMFCTGGIRCEKASAYLVQQGFEEVYQLEGGILKYLEDVEQAENLWQGECFVFDQRVSVDTTLCQGSYEQCFACRHPISEEDIASDSYEKGVSCPHCAEDENIVQRGRFRERQKQVDLARSLGKKHIGISQKL